MRIGSSKLEGEKIPKHVRPKTVDGRTKKSNILRKLQSFESSYEISTVAEHVGA